MGMGGVWRNRGNTKYNRCSSCLLNHLVLFQHGFFHQGHIPAVCFFPLSPPQPPSTPTGLLFFSSVHLREDLPSFEDTQDKKRVEKSAEGAYGALVAQCPKKHFVRHVSDPAIFSLSLSRHVCCLLLPPQVAPLDG